MKKPYGKSEFTIRFVYLPQNTRIQNGVLIAPYISRLASITGFGLVRLYA